MASGGQEEPFSRLALAVHCDESSLYLQKGSVHSCSNFGGKFQNGAPANSSNSHKKAFPVAQICPNSHKIVSSSMRAFPVAQIAVSYTHLTLPTKRIV